MGFSVGDCLVVKEPHYHWVAKDRKYRWTLLDEIFIVEIIGPPDTSNDFVTYASKQLIQLIHMSGERGFENANLIDHYFELLK